MDTKLSSIQSLNLEAEDKVVKAATRDLLSFSEALEEHNRKGESLKVSTSLSDL